MSVSALPEWKQLLLERKRREEEERERREKEEEERLASMPAWKRGIIQRRRAKQEGGGEREREGGQHSFVNRYPDGHCDDKLMLRQTDMETEMVSVETIGPIRQNPFIRSQNSYKREHQRRETEKENHGKEKEKEGAYEKISGEETIVEKEKDIERVESQCQEWDFRRGRDIDTCRERSRDRSEGRERVGTEVMKDRDRDSGRGGRKGERDGMSLPLVPGLRTITAENIIIIEKDTKIIERETQQEKVEKDKGKVAEEEERRGMRMDLKEFLASGGNVTEIRASEVLIIKPSITEKKSEEGRKGEGEQGNESRGSLENVFMNEKVRREGRVGNKRDQDGVMKEAVAQTWSSLDMHEGLWKQEDSGLGNGRVSQILSKFGQQPKPPFRSKSIDCFPRLGKDTPRVRLNSQTEEESQEETDAMGFRGVPKRSFSFSERVVCACEERKIVERAYSDRRHQPPVTVKNEQYDTVTMGVRRQGMVKNEQQIVMQRKKEIEGAVEKEEKRSQDIRMERGREEGKDKERKEQRSTETSSEVFSIASVRSPGGTAFARRVPIKQERKELKKLKEENEREQTIEKDRMRGQEIDIEKEKETNRQRMLREITEKERQTESVILRREEVTVVMESVKSLCSYTLNSQHWSNSYPVSDLSANSQHPTTSSATKPLQTFKMKGDDTADICKHENQSDQTVLPQHTQELRGKNERMQEIRDNKHVELRRESDTPVNKETESEKCVIWHEQDEQKSMANTKDYHLGLLKRADDAESSAMKSPKHTPGIAGVGQQAIRIPRSVFFGVDEPTEGCKAGLLMEDGQSGGGGRGRGLERKESWKAGRPLTRVESLREKIRQREMERQSRGEAEGEGEKETNRSDGEGMERGDRRKEVEGALRAVMGKQQEVTSPQTLSLFDVAKDVSMSKACPQLPASVPVSLLQTLSAGEEVQQLSSNRVIQSYSEQHEEFRCKRDADSLTTASGEEGETEEDLQEEEYHCPSLSPSPSSSLSPTPSPPLPDSLAAMSRIYNLKTVGSRTAVCISERNTDVPAHTRKVFPEGRFTPISHSVSQTSVCPQDRVSLGSDKTVRDSQPALTTETSPVQSVLRQIEQLQLKEQEVRQSSHGSEDSRDSPKRSIEVNTAEGQKRPGTQTETQKLQMPTSSRASPSQTGPRKQTKIPQPKSFTINAQNAPSPENIQKSPTSSPSTPTSVSHSPTLTNPSTSRSSPLFSIRSASGGPGNRGTTITITPRRPATGVSVASPAPASIPSTPPTQAPEPNNIPEGRKKRYPTVEEIEVIGGYQNLENSCLVRKKGTSRGVKEVSFNESELEQVCEYPSEDTVLASLPAAGEDQCSEEGRRAEGESDGQEEDEEEEGGAFVPSSAKSVGTSAGTARILRVDESCRR